MLDINLIRETPEVVREALKLAQHGHSQWSTRSWRWMCAGARCWPKSKRSRRERNSLERDRPEQRCRRTPGENRGHARVGDRIAALDEQVREVEESLGKLVATIPNLPDPSTPFGKDEHENVVMRTMGQAKAFDFTPHAALGPGTQAGHHRLRTGGQDHRLALLRAQRRRCAPAAGPDRLDARPAHPPGLHRKIHALHGQSGYAVRLGPTAQICR